MNETRKIRAIIFIIIFIAAAGMTTACARGTSEAGLPEAVEVKSAEQDPQSEAGNADQSYPPEGWVTDIREAYKLAQAGDKQILLNFTGSDWCIWCKKLSEEVFSTPEFNSYADENLVMLFLDSPQTIELSSEQIVHNQTIAQLLGVQGFPTIWLLDGDFSPLLSTGYRQGGADEYIRHLSEDRPEIAAEEIEQFRVAFTEAIETRFGPLN